MTTKARNEQLAAYDGALTRYATWFGRYCRPDGSLDAPGLRCSAYMPVPLYAYAVGEMNLLRRTLSYIGQRSASDDGFLRPPGKTLLPYRAAWMTMGAVLGEDFHLASRLEQWALTFRHQPTGGFFGSDPARKAGEGELCFDSTANVCAALAVSGNLAEAERAGDCLRRLLQAQPEPERRLFLVWDTVTGLVTQFDPKQSRMYAIEWGQPRQLVYKLGLVIRAFALLYARTGGKEWLQLAEDLYGKAVDRLPDGFTNTLAHKLGWAAWTLSLLTRKPEYTEYACRVADHLVGLQQNDGAFHYPEFWPPYEQVEIEQKFNIGCQFATWIIYARDLANQME